MPEIDGFEATQMMRALETKSGRARTPIIALTANAFEEDRERSLAAGMDAHLNKPYTADELTNLLSEWINRADPASVGRKDKLLA